MSVAILAVPVTLMAGAAIDFSGVSKARSAAQQALDAAVIAVASKGTLDSDLGNNVFLANIQDANILPATPSFSQGVYADGSPLFKGTATITIKTNFVSAIGFSTMTAEVASQARSRMNKPEITSVTFTPTNVQGAYSKDVFIWTKDASGKIISEQTVMTYRYNSATQTKTTSPTLNNSGVSTLVPKHATFGVGLVIYQDYVNYSGALINPKKQYSDAADAADWIRSKGQCDKPDGEAVDMEDGGDKNFKDFQYVVRCTMSPPSASGGAVLVR